MLSEVLISTLASLCLKTSHDHVIVHTQRWIPSLWCSIKTEHVYSVTQQHHLRGSACISQLQDGMKAIPLMFHSVDKRSQDVVCIIKYLLLLYDYSVQLKGNVLTKNLSLFRLSFRLWFCVCFKRAGYCGCWSFRTSRPSICTYMVLTSYNLSIYSITTK